MPQKENPIPGFIGYGISFFINSGHSGRTPFVASFSGLPDIRLFICFNNLIDHHDIIKVVESIG